MRCSSRAIRARAAGARSGACAKRHDPRSQASADARRGPRSCFTSTTPQKRTSSTRLRSIRQRGDQDALGALSGLPANALGGEERCRRAIRRRSRSSLALWTALQNTWYGLSLGSVLLLAAIGLAITFGVMGVINMAHGEMVMIGAYTDVRGAGNHPRPQPGAVRLSLAMPSRCLRGRGLRRQS